MRKINTTKNASWLFVSSRLRAAVVRLHRDERGAISVLVLLTIWCLVAILAMVWNTTEQAVRRQQIQTAADSAAHAASTWVARSVNAISAQNMIICQDASTEVIWNAARDVDQVLGSRLDSEILTAQQMKNNPAAANLQRRMQQQVRTIATEYQLTLDALGAIEPGTGANYADAGEAAAYVNSYRQVRSVMGWVTNTYVNGRPPPSGSAAPPRPGPPGPNGEGLVQLIAKWQPNATDTAVLDYIINFINTTEKPIVAAFNARTAPAVRQPVNVQMAAHEAGVYANELAMAAQLPDAIEAQRAQLADTYKTDITLAVVNNSAGSVGSARIAAPMIPASEVPPIAGHVDLIRVAYPVESISRGMDLIVDIDAISPNSGESVIWHPDIAAPVDPGLVVQFPGLRGSYVLRCNPDWGWGHIWAAPLERYFHERVDSDAVILDTDYMQPLDQSRTVTLANAIRQMLGLPAGNITIANLPGRLPDDQPDPAIPSSPIYPQVLVLPRLTAPAAATAAFRTQVQLYNRHGAAFTGAVRGLRGTLISYIASYNTFTESYAQAAWRSMVETYCRTIAQNLGKNKQFMVLATYRLREIPEWARDGMSQSVALSAEDQIVRMNIRPISQAIVNDLINADPQGLGGAILDPNFRGTILNAAYIGQATAIADAIVRPTAHSVAQMIAMEWINRPWPFEITPSEQPVPPSRGLGREDRQKYFTVLAAARQTDSNAPRLLLPSIFGSDMTKIVAYGQAEAFNWMEFNAGYGGAERFDEVVHTPWRTFVGSPRSWRAATVGGWNWRTRLSQSDTLYDALQTNDELSQYLQDAGIRNSDRASVEVVNVH